MAYILFDQAGRESSGASPVPLYEPGSFLIDLCLLSLLLSDHRSELVDLRTESNDQ